MDLEKLLSESQKLAQEECHSEVSPLHLAATLISDKNGIFFQAITKLGGEGAVSSIERELKRALKQQIQSQPPTLSSDVAQKKGKKNKKKKKPIPENSAVLLLRNGAKSVEDLILGLLEDRCIMEALKETVVHPKMLMRVVKQLREPNFLALHTYGTDFVATSLLIDPVIGRETEIDNVIRVLLKKNKNNPVLVGEPGVGKTAVIEGLAQRIRLGNVPTPLQGIRIFAISLVALAAGTRNRGDYEERLLGVIKEVEEANGNVVMFFDEIHMLLGAGGDGSNDAANMLKPMLARGSSRCIGATTVEEYQTYIQRDAAFERRFQRVNVREPTISQTVEILRGLKDIYEKYHKVKIEDMALVYAAQLSSRYITDRYFPDKAIDVLDNACVNVRVTLEGSSVGPANISEAVSQMSGIPVSKIGRNEKENLIGLAEKLHERVVGQDEAVHVVADSILRSRTGIGSPGKPIGSFLFLGPTGVGKTELAKAVAEILFQGEKGLIRIDMTEYMEEHTVSKLIGAPPGYVGYEKGGQLTDAVRKRPYCVILLDEAEKAHTAVFNTLLQVFDDGRLTDGQGQTVDFKNAVIIMTSNLGAEKLALALNGEISMSVARGRVMEDVKRFFKPELLNRLDGIVIFEPLSHEVRRKVAELQMKSLKDRLMQKGITLAWTDSTVDFILKQCHDPGNGARPIQRYIENRIVTHLSKMIVEDEIGENSWVCIDGSDASTELIYGVRDEKMID